MFKVIGFIWRRWADLQSLQAIWDLFGLKGTVLSLGSGGVVLTWAAYDNWTPLGVWLAAFGFAAFVAVIYIALRLARVLRLQERISTDDRVSRALPDSPQIAPTATRDIGLGEAVAFICFRQWGKSFLDAAGSSEVDGAAEYDHFLQAAADGAIPIWGKRESYGVYEPIPNTYWFQNRIEWFSLLRGKPESESSKHTFSGDKYLSLMTSRALVEQQWPASKLCAEAADEIDQLRDMCIRREEFIAQNNLWREFSKYLSEPDDADHVGTAGDGS